MNIEAEQKLYDAEIERIMRSAEFLPFTPFDGWMLRAALAAPQHCTTCDGSGDVHRTDGEWLGECTVCKETAAPVLSDEEILEAMRPELYEADGGYVCDTEPKRIITAGRALLSKVTKS